jgi:hypothetical protein
MTGTITRTACPECGEVGYLYIDTRFVSKPLGTFSIAGAQMKTVGKMKPVLRCHNCPFDLVGEFDGGNHAVFSPPKTGEPDGGQTEQQG